MRGRSKSSGILFSLSVFLILLVAAALSRRLPKLEALQRVVQARTVDIAALGSGDTREILQRLEALHVVPGEPSSGSTGKGVGRSQTLSLDPIAPEEIAKILQIDPEWLAKGLPVAVLMMEAADLEELHANPFARGREWERPAFFAYLENGELQLTTQVGFRIHGGWGRGDRSHRSYRIYFRNRYGVDHFPRAFFPTGGGRSPRVVVIRNDHGTDSSGRVSPMISSLAYEIVRRIGAPAPRTKPVVFYVNGEHLGTFHFSERMDRDFLLSHFGHEDFVMARTESAHFMGRNPSERRPVTDLEKVRVGPPEVYQEFREWARNYSDLDLAAIAERVDIDNLSRWFLAVLYCSNHDPFQGSLLLDLRRPTESWYWLPWDFDASFLHTLHRRLTLEWFFDPPETTFINDERGWLLKQLITSSPEYRNYLARLFVEMVNHRTTNQFIRETVDQHRRTAEIFEVRSDHFSSIRQFLLYQPRHLSRMLQHALQQGPIFPVTVTAPAGRELIVDGYPHGSKFIGMYYSGMLTDIAVSESDRKDFSRWRVDGQKFRKTPLRIEIDHDLTIRAVFKKSRKRESA